jgi:hypothetical protein
MNRLTKTVNDTEAQLADFMAECYADPLLHVLTSYPWGHGLLEGREGPDVWQAQFLTAVGKEVTSRGFDGRAPVDPIQFSTASGHGIGKSAVTAWLIRWIMDTRPFCKGVVTANTSEQLRTKTWAELAKWNNMGLTKHWYHLNSGGGSMNYYHKDHRETWRVDAQTSREENSEAFAGLHSATSTPFYIFDEASAIPEKIFEVREGGLTDGEPMTFDFGNPTRNSGRFYENMVGRFRHRFNRKFIDSRDVLITNKKLLNQWVEVYGEDSDFVKVRVKGEFPSAGALQFIGSDIVDPCIMQDIAVTSNDPVVMGVDVARFGDDQSVVVIRTGRDAESKPMMRYRGVDTMTLASEVARLASDYKPDTIFIDGGGVGGGVVDRCRQLAVEVMEINFGSKATMPQYANMRAQCWGNLKQALTDGMRLPDDPDLKSDLTSVEYGYNIRNQIQLEKKEDMKKRGLHSPDIADALALTYAMPVLPTRASYDGSHYSEAQHDYDPFN